MFRNSMFGYYFDLALRSFRRNKVLTALMVLAIALGIGASMTTLTVFHVLSGDPLPGKSHTVFYPQIEPRSMGGYVAGEEPSEQWTRYDAEALLRDAKGDRQAMMSGGAVAVEPQIEGLAPFYADARYPSADFFPMFELPFAHGKGWGAAEDSASARAAVISAALNEKLFGGRDSVGRTIQLDQQTFQVIGVLDEWRPTPRFYDLTNTRYGEVEQVFLPFSTSRALELGTSGNMNCWEPVGDAGDDGGNYSINAPCAWIQYWVE